MFQLPVARRTVATKKPMTLDEAKKLVRELSAAAIASYRSVNEPGRKSTAKAVREEEKAIRKVLSALTTDCEVTDIDVDECME